MAVDSRKRNWACILYPESCVENWEKILDGQYLPWMLSPLHDNDLDDEGNIKKAHYHLLFLFEGKKSYFQILDICKSIGATIPVPVGDARKMVRYLCHLDETDHKKAKYQISDIVNHTGNDISKYFLPSADEQLRISGEIMRFIEENQITEFTDLESIIFHTRYNEWYLVLRNDKYFFDMKIRSLRNVLKGIPKSN